MHEEEKVAAIPTAEETGVDGIPLDPVYCDRGPYDVVLSGPLGFRTLKIGEAVRIPLGGPGRWFETEWDALAWAEGKYGADRVRLILGEGNTRWAVLVKNLLK